jgi:hypothetical protein
VEQLQRSTAADPGADGVGASAGVTTAADAELEAAATRIQAQVRRRQAAEEVEQLRQRAGDGAVQPSAAVDVGAGGGLVADAAADAELEAAATRIQAQVRRRQAAEEVEHLRRRAAEDIQRMRQRGAVGVHAVPIAPAAVEPRPSAAATTTNSVHGGDVAVSVGGVGGGGVGVGVGVGVAGGGVSGGVAGGVSVHRRDLEAVVGAGHRVVPSLDASVVAIGDEARSESPRADDDDSRDQMVRHLFGVSTPRGDGDDGDVVVEVRGPSSAQHHT